MKTKTQKKNWNEKKKYCEQLWIAVESVREVPDVYAG